MSVATIWDYRTETGSSGNGGRVPPYLHLAGDNDDAYGTSRERDAAIVAEMEPQFEGQPLLRNRLRHVGSEAFKGAQRTETSQNAAAAILHELDVFELLEQSDISPTTS